MKTKSLLLTVAIFTIVLSMSAQEKGTFTDSRDGKVYKTVKIGTQTWMAENLAYKTSSGCWANKEDENVATYGYLYDWETAKKVCPKGWHLPTNLEWSTLSIFLGGASVAGGKLKSTLNWDSPNTGATNKSGFKALPGGYRLSDDDFSSVGSDGDWWSSTELSTSNAWSLEMIYDESTISRIDCNKEGGCSVRCIKD